jgi:hypothetical protein
MDWKNWLKAAGVRAIKTFAQTCVSLLGGDMVGILQVDWIGILAVGATAATTSLLTSLAGLPEIKNEQK